MTQQTLIAANAPTLAVSVTATASASANLPSTGETVMVYNEGPDDAWGAIGYGTQTATLPTGTAATTCIPLPAKALVVYALQPALNTTNVATATNMPNTTAAQISAISRATKTATLTVTVGSGS